MKSKIAYHIVRVILGLAWLFFGVTKFFPFGDPQLPGPATAFLAAMGATGYMIQFVGIAEIIVGVLLLANLAVPLAMMVLSPVMLNVILFNLFLAPSTAGVIMLLVLVILQVYVMYCTWSAYVPLFHKKKW
jgi:putative oxidoreductase